MNTLTDFKRILDSDGVQLEQLGLANNAPDNARIYRGLIRNVIRTNTQGAYLTMANGDPSFMDYGKASEWEFDGDLATHNSGLKYRVIKAV